MKEYRVERFETIKTLEDWFLVQDDFEAVVNSLAIEEIIEEEGFRGCLIDQDVLNNGDYELDNVAWYFGTVPYLSCITYKIVLVKSYEIFDLYHYALEDFNIDSGDLSIEVFEVQYWNKFNCNPEAIWEELGKEF